MPHPTSPPPLTLAFHTLDYPPDAFVSSIGYYTARLAEALAARGHRVHVVSRAASDSTERRGNLTIHRLSPARVVVPGRMNLASTATLAATGLAREWRYRQRLAQKLAALVEREGVALIEAADSAAEGLFYRPSNHPRVPLVVRLHGPTSVWELFDKNVPEVARRLVAAVERRFFLRATHLTTPSTPAAALFRKTLRLGERPITVYPNPLSFDVTQTEPLATHDPNRVLFVGRITEFKGVDVLIRAIPKVLARCPEARFVFIGPDSPTGRNYNSTQDYLMTLLPSAYHHTVTFTGFKPHHALVEAYQQAALCTLPSVFDNFPYTCLEAMSFGKAIIGSRNGGMADMLEGGRCGLLYTPPDDAELASHIVTLLKDPAQRTRLGQAARQRVLTCYRDELILDKVETFYRYAIAELADA